MNIEYKYKKNSCVKYGSYYFKKGMGKKEKPEMTPYSYGTTKLETRRKRK